METLRKIGFFSLACLTILCAQLKAEEPAQDRASVYWRGYMPSQIVKYDGHKPVIGLRRDFEESPELYEQIACSIFNIPTQSQNQLYDQDGAGNPQAVYENFLKKTGESLNLLNADESTLYVFLHSHGDNFKICQQFGPAIPYEKLLEDLKKLIVAREEKTHKKIALFLSVEACKSATVLSGIRKAFASPQGNFTNGMSVVHYTHKIDVITSSTSTELGYGYEFPRVLISMPFNENKSSRTLCDRQFAYLLSKERRYRYKAWSSYQRFPTDQNDPHYANISTALTRSEKIKKALYDNGQDSFSFYEEHHGFLIYESHKNQLMELNNESAFSLDEILLLKEELNKALAQSKPDRAQLFLDIFNELQIPDGIAPEKAHVMIAQGIEKKNWDLVSALLPQHGPLMDTEKKALRAELEKEILYFKLSSYDDMKGIDSMQFILQGSGEKINLTAQERAVLLQKVSAAKKLWAKNPENENFSDAADLIIADLGIKQ